MKIYISIDIEGIYGYDGIQKNPSEKIECYKQKSFHSNLMKNEIISLSEGLKLNDVKQIMVIDSHSTGKTLKLPNNSNVIRQVKRDNHSGTFPKLNKSYAGIILWGYHVKSGSKSGKWPHTFSYRVKSVKLNGTEVGEVYLYALYAHNLGAPLIAVSGDLGLKKEVRKDIGEIPFFCSDVGSQMSKDEYLLEIKKFTKRLNIKDIVRKSKQINWPNKTQLEVTYKNPLVSIARWILKRQYRHSKITRKWSCIYSQGNFNKQLDNYKNTNKRIKIY